VKKTNAQQWMVLIAAGLFATACSVKGKANASLNNADKDAPLAEAEEPVPEEPAPEPAPPAPEPKKYTDSQGNEVEFEGGDRAFADEVIEFTKGDPFTTKETEANGESIIGAPNFQEVGDGSMVSLGCGGSIVIRFKDNALKDGEGPDLHIFEVGPQIEPFKVEIARNKKMKWKEVGIVEGQPAQVDISAVKGANKKHKFVRLTDMKSGCKGDHPGSDIDAIGTYKDEAPLTAEEEAEAEAAEE